MRWIRYEANDQTVYGIVDDDMVTEMGGDPFAGCEKTATRQPLSSVKLLVPVIRKPSPIRTGPIWSESQVARSAWDRTGITRKKRPSTSSRSMRSGSTARR